MAVVARENEVSKGIIKNSSNNICVNKHYFSIYLLEQEIFKPRIIKEKYKEVLYYKVKNGFWMLLFDLRGLRGNLNDSTNKSF